MQYQSTIRKLQSLLIRRFAFCAEANSKWIVSSWDRGDLERKFLLVLPLASNHGLNFARRLR
jgi:hypothetical protein